MTHTDPSVPNQNEADERSNDLALSSRCISDTFVQQRIKNGQYKILRELNPGILVLETARTFRLCEKGMATKMYMYITSSTKMRFCSLQLHPGSCSAWSSSALGFPCVKYRAWEVSLGQR